MNSRYKKKSGYQLKKGKSGEMRWHKIKTFLQENARATPLSYAKKNLIDNEKYKELNKVIPGISQMSFIVPPGSMDLSIPVSHFYNAASNLWLPRATGAVGDVFYHGTPYDFERFADEAGERPVETGHWNNVLGNHFTDNYEVADKFRAGGNHKNSDLRSRFRDMRKKGGRVIKAVIESKNPLVVHDEATFDNLALSYMLKDWSSDDYEQLKGLVSRKARERLQQLADDDSPDANQRLLKISEIINYETSPSELFQHLYRDSEAWESDDDDDDTYGVPAWYGEMLGEGEKFKKYLQQKGFDSVIYNNFVEGRIGVIPMNNDQIKYAENRPNPKDLLETSGKNSPYRSDYERHIDESQELGDEIEHMYLEKPGSQIILDRMAKRKGTSRFDTVNKARSLIVDLRSSDDTYGVRDLLRRIQEKENG